MKVKVKKDTNFLSINKIYDVISIEYECFRILNDQGEPILYPTNLFEIVDNRVQKDWIVDIEEDGSIEYVGPEIFNNYFFEDYFDGNENIKYKFNNWLKQKIE